MCLSTVYRQVGEELQELASHVSSITAEGDSVTFTDIMGISTTVEGSIESVDLVANKIVVKAA